MSDLMRITTGEVRLSYVKVFTPSDTGKYEVTCLLPKSDTTTKAQIDQAIAVAKQVGTTSKWGGVQPPIVPDPMWDGDGVRSNGEAFGPECKGCWVFTARSNEKPIVVDASVQEIINQSEVYSGAYGKVSFLVYPYLYSETKKKGIRFILNGVQKLRDGEVLGGGRPSAGQMFQAVQTDADGFMPAPKVDPFSGKPM